ncbi:hypothetical protein JYT99_00680 [bacterium AH-315-E09]|nr:hypothetical protein [bacterium AH-315-E09]
MTSPDIKKRATYRLTPKLDRMITEESKILGISKNAFVQLTLTKVLQLKEVDTKKTIG